MWGKIPNVDRLIYNVVNYHKNNTDKDRKGFRTYLSEKLKISPSMSTVNRWVSDIETNHHMPAFVLAAFVEYYNIPDNKDPDAPSVLSPLTYLAHEAGFCLYPYAPSLNIDISSMDFFQAVAKNQKESADVISVAAAAISDGDITQKELENIQVELLEQLEAVSILLGLTNKKMEQY
jgi:hypothetical protein